MDFFLAVFQMLAVFSNDGDDDDDDIVLFSHCLLNTYYRPCATVRTLHTSFTHYLVLTK